ncbi:MAG TPA: hypothetical protein VK616_03695, partial [Flavitalea sp.]|nr:hypothetical protein [Flavitalea sp.]
YYATAKFVSPDNIILGNDGLLYVADGTYRIRRVDMRGNASTYAGSSVGYQNGPALSAKFHKLWSMCQNSYGAIFVTEYNVVRKIFY